LVKSIKDDDGNIIFDDTHWEPTKNPGGARVYCGKEDGRLDGPWVFGQNGNKKRSWNAIAEESKSVKEFMDKVRIEKEHFWWMHQARIQESAKVFYKKEVVYRPRWDRAQYREDPKLTAWVNENIGLDVPKDRYKLLVVAGPNLLGKTGWARSLGKHVYWKNRPSWGMFVEEDSKDYQFVICDDMDIDVFRPSEAKGLLCGMGPMVVTGKYLHELNVDFNKPCIWLTNDESLGAFYMCTNWLGTGFNWTLNCEIVKIKEQMWI